MSIPGSASPLFFGAGAADAAAFQIDRSIRLNSGDSAYLNRTPSSAGNRKTWTWSGWVKRSALGSQKLFIAGSSGTEGGIQFHSGTDNMGIRFYDYQSGAHTIQLDTNALFRDPSAWMHIVGSIDTTQATASDRAKLYINGEQVTSFATATYPSQNLDTLVNNNIAHYLGWVSPSGNYFNGYLAEIHFIDGVSGLTASDFGEEDSNGVWQPKAYSGSYGTTGFYLKFADNSSNAALGTDSSGNSNTWTVNNLQAVVDTGVPVSAAWTGYAGGAWSSSDTWDSLSDASTNFGNNGGSKGYSSTTETWTAVKSSWSGAFGASIRGSNGWALKFSSSVTITVNPNASSIVACASTSTAVSAGTSYTSFPATMTGQVFWFTGSNYPDISIFGSVALPSQAPIDSLIDTPTNYTADSGNNGGNYCTWNPLSTTSTPTFSDGNLTVTNSGSGSSGWRNIASTMAVSSGKWYMEFQTVGSMNGGLFIGIQKVPEDNDQFNPASFSNNFVGMTANSYSLNAFSGNKRTNGSDSSYGSGQAVNDILMMAVDLDNGKIWWGKNGTWFASGDPDSGTNAAFTGLSGTFVFAVGISASEKIHSNWGQRPFAYSNNISGFNSVCTQNLDESAYASIADGSTAMDVALYTGNASARSISGFSYSPDLVWLKARSAAQFGNHALFDVVRGATKALVPNDTQSEQTETTQLTAFNSDGFSLGGSAGVNANNETYVAWAWDAGTSTVSNTDGNITSNVRANQTAGFSIVTYTGNSGIGQTVGHGLNAAPEFIIVKTRDSNIRWGVYHKVVGPGNTLVLNTTTTPTGGTGVWGNTYPTNSVFYISNDGEANKNGDEYVAYCFAPVEGYSAFGSFVSNNSTDNVFVHTGFRPRFVLWKRSSSTGAWLIFDAERNPYNNVTSEIVVNTSAAEVSTSSLDFLSNGFKVRETLGGTATFLYMAFASHPFRTARAR